MKILRHGDTMMNGKCPKCRCEFLYQKHDIEYSYDRINAYESELEYTYITCPECGRKVIIDDFRKDTSSTFHTAPLIL